MKLRRAGLLLLLFVTACSAPSPSPSPTPAADRAAVGVLDLDRARTPFALGEVVDAKPDVCFAGLGFPRQERVISDLRGASPGTWFLGCGAADVGSATRVCAERDHRGLSRRGQHSLVNGPVFG